MEVLSFNRVSGLGVMHQGRDYGNLLRCLPRPLVFSHGLCREILFICIFVMTYLLKLTYQNPPILHEGSLKG